MKPAFLIILFFSSFCSFAQNAAIKRNLDTTSVKQVIYEDEVVAIFYTIEPCYPEIGFDQEKIILQLQNKTSLRINISWHSLLYYNGKCNTCDYPNEYTSSFELIPNQSLIGDCSLNSNHGLTFFSKFIDENYTGNAELTDFSLKDIKTSIISKW